MSGRNRNAFSDLQLHLTDSNWIRLILLIKLTQYKIGKTGMDVFQYFQVNKALALDSRKKQWADLGVQTQSCLVIPGACGPEDAAVAFWMFLRNCAYAKGIMSSTFAWPTKKTGFRIYCVSWHLVRYVKKQVPVSQGPCICALFHHSLFGNISVNLRRLTL